MLFVAVACWCGCCQGQPSSESAVEQQMRGMGLVDVQYIDSTLDVQLVYATCHNFMGKVLYRGITKAFLTPDAARMLKKAHELLRQERLDLHLVVYDAARPVAVQREMWKLVEGTTMEDFVSNPAKGRGMHNYGAAVDVTLVDCTGHPLAMGSEYDFFGPEARVDVEEELLQKGRITQREYENRQLLRRVMTQAGFRTIQSEWWHFNATDSKSVAQHYKLID